MHALAQFLEPWRTLFADSLIISTTITTAHILALLVGGGLALSADRTTLRTLRISRGHWEREFQIREIKDLHRPVLIGLLCLAATGLLLAASDVEVFFASPVFWIKMGLIILLLFNGSVLYRTERTLTGALESGEVPPARLWGRLRVTAWASLTLWLLTASAGAILAGSQ